MTDRETAVLEMLNQGGGTQTLLGGSGAVKERIRRAREASDSPESMSCGGVGGGWGNSPEATSPEAIAPSCGGVGGGWGNSPEA